MYSLLYFDTEDYFSPADSPVHWLPMQFAQIMKRNGLVGCFHIHGEKVRFMEKHGQRDVIEAVREHDVSLHYDRGSVHPTTAEEVSQLDWFRAVERVMFREATGFATLKRVMGKCSGLTQHGGTFAAPIVYAAGKMGYPFLYSPFSVKGRGVVWYCNNLVMAGAEGAGSVADTSYRDTSRFEKELEKVEPYLKKKAGEVDFRAMFGAHPLITIMKAFPDDVNFAKGRSPRRAEWVAPEMVEGVDIGEVMRNFERYIKVLVAQKDVQWTTVAGIADIYGWRPVEVRDEAVMKGAAKVVENCGPTFTEELSAGELLYLLAMRVMERKAWYEMPQVMGPVDEADGATDEVQEDTDVEKLSAEVVDAVMKSSYLPGRLDAGGKLVSPGSALVRLACDAVGVKVTDGKKWRTGIEAIENMEEATERVKTYKAWNPHGPEYHQDGIIRHFQQQGWTLKPAMQKHEYGADVKLGRQFNAMIR